MSLFRGIRYFLLNENNKQKILKSILGFRPGNIALYEQAFTHKSVSGIEEGGENESNERLEFLGDAVLGAIIAEYFFVKFPHKKEGELTKLRSKLVSRSFLNRLAVDMGLDTFLETSADTKRSKSLFGDAFEALIGAIYLDKGFESCRKFVVEKVIRDYIELKEVMQSNPDYKSRLVELSQKNKKSFRFENLQKQGENTIFYHSILYLEGIKVAEGEGPSKKKAEQMAAQNYFKNSP